MGQCPGVLPAAPLGPDRMSDWLEEAALHAAPSGGAIVDRTKEGVRRGRGPARSGQAAGEDASLPAHTGRRSQPRPPL